MPSHALWRKFVFNNIFDSHAHYDDKWFDEDREELLCAMPRMGVCTIVNAAVDLNTAKIALDYTSKFDFMYSTVGFHPENLENMPDDYLSQMACFAKNEKVVAIGEIGLDYHWDIDKQLQKKFLKNN